jgi:UDP-glucose 4-epimerase
VISRYDPDAPALFARRGCQLPQSIGRVYDCGKAERILGFRAWTDFGGILEALRRGRELPLVHNPRITVAKADGVG